MFHYDVVRCCEVLVIVEDDMHAVLCDKGTFELISNIILWMEKEKE
jgi:hypothetical protein